MTPAMVRLFFQSQPRTQMILFRLVAKINQSYPMLTDLQWAPLKKNMILIICAFYSFLGNCALLGPSVYLEIYV